MDWSAVGPIVVAITGLLSAGFAFYAKQQSNKSQSNKDNIQQVFDAMRAHMATLASENSSMRTWRDSQTEIISRLQMDRADCERDKADMRVKIEHLERRLDEQSR